MVSSKRRDPRKIILLLPLGGRFLRIVRRPFPRYVPEGSPAEKAPEAPISPVANSRSRPSLHKHTCNLARGMARVHESHDTGFAIRVSPCAGWAPIFTASPPVSLFRYFIRPRHIYIARILAGYI